MALTTRDFAGTWGCDTNTKLTAAAARSIVNTPMGVPKKSPAGQDDEHDFVWALFFVRYVFFGPARPGDISLGERDDILSTGAGLALVQHPRSPDNNVLNESTGAADAEWAIRNALGAGYDPALCVGAPPTLFLDMEGVKNPGLQSQAHAVRWVTDVRTAGFMPGVYFGFDWGVASLIALGDFCPWVDFAPLTMRPHWPWSLQQFKQVTVAGIGVDPDQALGPFVGMIDADLALIRSGDGAAGQTSDPASGGGATLASRGFPLPFEVRESEVPE